MATVELRYSPQNSAWFTANATLVLKAGEPAYHSTTGQFKLGDGTTQLSALPFLPTASGGGSGVPYTGATGNVDLGEYQIRVGQLELDQSPTGTAGVTITRWNNTLGSTETTLKGGSVVLKNGVDLVARVVNKVNPNTTLTKAAYQVVKVTGAQGQRLAVNLAQANNDNNSADTLGIVIETIPTNQEGFIICVGQIENINTTGSLQGESWADGDVLYLSPTTPGAVTKVKPTGATGHIVVLGYVEYAHANNGKIYVKVMNGWELDELHNVSITTPANNEILTYENSTSLWKNKTVTTALGFTPYNSTNPSGFVTTSGVPYTGATGDVDLGAYKISATNINLPNTTTSSTGIVNKNSLSFLHNFQHPTGGGAIPTGKNTMIGEEAGNFTMGSTATSTFHSSNNVLIGYRSGLNNTLGYNNVFNGASAGLSNTTGYSNVFCGVSAGTNNTTGYFNVYLGDRAGQSGVSASGYQNIGIGTLSLSSNTTGFTNVFIGHSAGQSNTTGFQNAAIHGGGNNTTGYNNVFVGYNSGGTLANGSTANQTANTSVFIGANTKALSAGNTNQTVIGNNATGNGSNTVTIGDTSVTENYLNCSLKLNAATKTYSTGNLTSQNFSELFSNTVAFVGASTITNSFNLYVNEVTAGTNATITNNFGIGCTNLYIKSRSTSTSNKALQIRNTAQSADFLYVRGDGLTFVGDVQVGNGLGSGTFHVYGNQGQTSDIVRIYSANSVNIFEFRQSSNNALMYLRSSTNTLGVQLTGQSGGTNYIDGIVSIGSTTSVASAVMNVDSTTKGFLPPRMTTTQKNAIATPTAGLIVYDTTTNKACCYNGTIWNDLF